MEEMIDFSIPFVVKAYGITKEEANDGIFPPVETLEAR